MAKVNDIFRLTAVSSDLSERQNSVSCSHSYFFLYTFLFDLGVNLMFKLTQYFNKVLQY